jgi:hypothetical protein
VLDASDLMETWLRVRDRTAAEGGRERMVVCGCRDDGRGGDGGRAEGEGSKRCHSYCVGAETKVGGLAGVVQSIVSPSGRDSCSLGSARGASASARAAAAARRGRQPPLNRPHLPGIGT